MEAAVADYRGGRLEAAISGYRRVLRLHPAFPAAHNNLGAALKAARRPEEAAASYRRALELRPDYAAAHANLAATLAGLGHRQDGLKHAFHAMRLEPGNLRHRQILTDALRTKRFTQASPWIVQAVESCFVMDGIEHQLLTPAAVSLLKLNPVVSEALAIVTEGNDETLSAALRGQTLRPLFKERLLQAVLTRTLVHDPAFERLLTAVRRCALRELTTLDGPVLPGLYDDDPGLIAALACQCFINEYAFAETAEETALVAGLAERRLKGSGLAPAEVVLAMYRPLYGLPGREGLAEQSDHLAPALAALVRQQLLEPLAEGEIARDLPRLTPIEDAVSGAVRDQYEANPYPRWLSTGTKAARPLGEVVAALFPHIERPPAGQGPTRVLIAGCGTGKHTVYVAMRYSGAQILAIDLSRASLAYGARKAREAGLSNVRFAVADVLALGSLDERFDLIEAVGVLHHLAEPLEGWRVLAALLAEGGFMKVGLYSQRAREGIGAARDHLLRKGFATDAASLRAARQAILALAPEDPARKVVGERDFYCLSGCRDMLFNVQECAFTLPQIAEMHERLGLEFLGFEFVDPEAKQAYAKRFARDPAMLDLKLWDAFEQSAPDTFLNMYQFWCRRV